MTETFGLVATSETPLVICDVMRSGPSTGMPTKQEQGDLNMTLYGGHGEVPRFVVAPTTVSECFWKTVEAFNLAEKYQTPVYLVSDLSLAVTEQTFPPEAFDMDAVEVDRGKVVDGDVEDWQNEKGQFTPHAATDDGVSPRAFPGTTGGAHMTTGLEHDELGRRTEDVDVRVEQVDKRQRKVETAREREDWSPREFGDPDSDTLVISWGSNEGAMVEAMEYLSEEGIDVRFLSVPYLFPRPDLSAAIEAADDVIVVEFNATGQFADVLEHDALVRVQRINKYNGVRFKADELAADIRNALDADVASEGEEVRA
jgi:2-oxoglutarate ferredoxin oxidoreductase subunit alpha